MKWKRIIEWIYDYPHKKGVLLHDKYKIDEVLGMGGYGIIYRCIDIGSNKNCVLKQLRPSKARRTKEKERFHTETEIMRAINHSQIPQLVDYFTINSQSYYVMQEVRGTNLEDVLFAQKRTFSEVDALLLVEKLLYILDYLHDKLIFHGDIRPPNIILHHEEIYLIDFGLAKQLDAHNKEEILIKKQDDFFDLADILLFILYSQYKGKRSRRKSWLEELTLSSGTVFFLKKLLGINEPYTNNDDIHKDLQLAIQALREEG